MEKEKLDHASTSFVFGSGPGDMDGCLSFFYKLAFWRQRARKSKATETADAAEGKKNAKGVWTEKASISCIPVTS